MNIALRAPTARLLLRDACGDAHARLDGRLSGLDLTRRDVYAATLSRMSGPLTALEAGLAREGMRMLPDWSARTRASALREDLCDLGGPFVDCDARVIEDEAEALGVLYVLEGSRLGGRLLAERVAESADETVRSATRYFRHGEGARFWQSFLQLLEASPAVRNHPARAADGAKKAFSMFEAAFS